MAHVIDSPHRGVTIFQVQRHDDNDAAQDALRSLEVGHGRRADYRLERLPCAVKFNGISERTERKIA